MEMITASFECARCGEINETSVDPSQGARQAYVEDCQVCCCPNALAVSVDGEDAFIEASPESE